MEFTKSPDSTILPSNTAILYNTPRVLHVQSSAACRLKTIYSYSTRRGRSPRLHHCSQKQSKIRHQNTAAAASIAANTISNHNTTKRNLTLTRLVLSSVSSSLSSRSSTSLWVTDFSISAFAAARSHLRSPEKTYFKR